MTAARQWGAEDYIRALELQPHPEGGHYRRTYASADQLPVGVSGRHAGARPLATAIHFLLRSGEVSHLHRLQSDELWHFHLGDPLRIHMLHPDGRHEVKTLGAALWQGMSLQVAVPHGVWFGAEPVTPATSGFSLISATVAPGFDFADFELADRARLLRQHPDHNALIERLTSGRQAGN